MSGASQQASGSSVDDDVSLLDLLIALAKHKNMIVTVSLTGALLAAVVSVLFPNIYTATARVLPPQQSQSAAAMLLGQLSGLPGLGGGSLGLRNPNELYVGMLRSRTIADRIVQRFDLKTLYDRDTMEETRETLADNTSISTGKDGIVAIAFDDEDPKRAADVANAYVEELDRLNRSLAVTEAAQRRLFFEQQLRQARDDLSDAEIRLKVTQERTGVIKLDDQGRAMIEAVAALRGQIAAKEVEIRALRTFATESNADLVRSQQELVGLRTELAKLERTPFFESGSVLVPMGKVPEVGLEYLRKVRDVKYHETIFEVIAKQYEAARIDEAKESSIVQIVDRAVAPDRKSKPKRSIIVIVVALLIGFIASIFAVLAEGYQRLEQDPRDARRLELLRFNLRRWRS